MEFDVVLTHDEETGHWIAQVPSLIGCHTQGATREEALSNIHEAIDLCLEEDHPRAVHFARVSHGA